MRPLLLASSLLVAPGLALANPQCALPLPAEAAIALPVPVRVGTGPAAPASAPATAPVAALVSPSSPMPSSDPTAAAEPGSAAPSSVASAMGKVPVLAHVAAAGAQLTDLGTSHGMRTVLARSGDELMVLEVAPDGQAAVAGLMADLSVSQLVTAAGSSVTELGTQHGLRTLFVRSGSQFQVFYATPDSERVIPGVLWDAAGKNLTREQVASVAGAIPTVIIGEAGAAATAQPAAAHAAAPGSLLAAVQGATSGTTGSASAPRLWMFIDPQCSFSVRAMQQLQPYVASGRVRLSVIPISVLDYEDQGRSTTSALAMLSKPEEQMVAAWGAGQLTGAVAPEAAAKLQANMAAAQAVALRGTPTFVWRKADGTEGRADGVPNDLGALISSIGG